MHKANTNIIKKGLFTAAVIGPVSFAMFGGTNVVYADSDNHGVIGKVYKFEDVSQFNTAEIIYDEKESFVIQNLDDASTLTESKVSNSARATYLSDTGSAKLAVATKLPITKNSRKKQKSSDVFVDEFSDDMFAIDGEEVLTISDPFISLNKKIYSFNMTADRLILKPVTQTYKKTLHPSAQKGLSNFYSNLVEPVSTVNLMLQGRPLDSTKSLFRFVYNTMTTLGFGDMAATGFEVYKTNEDFGQTLAVWGVPNGPYIMMPLLGPTSLRDSASMFVDTQVMPIHKQDNDTTFYAIKLGEALDKRSQLLDYEEVIKPTYNLVKDSYVQKRDYEVHKHEDVTF